MTTTTSKTQSFYSAMSNPNDQLFDDEQIQRYDADTIKNRYGESWKNFASNVREITQPDGSIVKEYIIEDPSLLEEIKSTTGSDDEHQQSLKNKFAQIKAKFEQKKISNVMASPTTSSATSNNTTTARQNSRKQIDDLYARHRRGSNESIPMNRINTDNKTLSNQSIATPNSSHRSQSIGNEKSKTSSFRRFNSADEADEEVSRIHRQGEELRRHHQQLAPTSSSSSLNDLPQRSQYEIVDEDGNPMAIDGVQDLIKMSGVHAREVPQSDGTIIKEYVIDDPQLLSQFRSQQRNIPQDAPPPPPRIPLRPPILVRQGGSAMNDHLLHNIQQIQVLEPQHRYEYLTTNGRRIQFLITNHGQSLTDSDIRELTNAINLRIFPSSAPVVQQQSPAQTSFNLPKQWYPSVDLTHRQRIGSDTQQYSNNSNIGFQQIQTDLTRSASSGVLNQGPYFSQNQVMNESGNDWNTTRYQNNETFQTSAQFLPQQQTTKLTHSPNTHPSAFHHQQSINYPYQGQQQHGVRILNDFNQQRTAISNDGHTRI